MPPALGASVYAIACALSYDGLSGITLPVESVESPTSVLESQAYLQFLISGNSHDQHILRPHSKPTRNTGHKLSKSLRPCEGHGTSLMSHNAHQTHQSALVSHGTSVLAANGAVRSCTKGNKAANLSDPSSHNVGPPLHWVSKTAHQKPPSEGTRLLAINGGAKVSEPLSQTVGQPVKSTSRKKRRNGAA